MLQVLLAVALTHNTLPSQGVTEACGAERLAQFVSPYGVSQNWPQVAAVPSQFSGRLGVVLGESGNVRDGYRHVLHVDLGSRSSYVMQQGGIAGAVTVYGPLPVASCSKAVL